MPLSRGIARFQRRYVHPLVRGLATWLPGYGLLIHVGRKSGKTYRTPLNVFKTADGYAIVLIYGRESDWLRNLIATNGADLVRLRRRYRLSNPRIVSGPEVVASLPFYGRLGSKLTRSPEVVLVDATAR